MVTPAPGGDLREKLRICEQTIAGRPDDPKAHNVRGNLLQDLRRYNDAVASYDRALGLEPHYPHAYCNRGNALQALRRFEDAVESYGKAIDLKPDFLAAYTNRGNAFKTLSRFDEALQSYESAVALSPGSAELHSNLGNALQELKRLDEAVESYSTAIALKPDYPEAYSNRGVALKELRRLDEALASFDRALELRPGYPEAVWNKSLVHLLLGQYDIGWRWYEARKNAKRAEGNRTFGKPLWLGSPSISGKAILIHWEQGFGDVIQFCRYVRLLGDAGAKVLLAPQKPLQALMRSLDARAHVVDFDNLGGLRFDFQCPVMSLPLAFKTEDSTIPHAPYLLAAERKVAEWQHRLGGRVRPRVGVVWTGNIAPDKERSIPFEQFRRLFSPRFEFVSLQKEMTDAERAWMSDAGIFHPEKALADFSDTAALCQLMDLVISIDTSVAHLAGALGRPVWTLLPWMADWRWLLDREDSPWYPTMRLFRQKARRDWDGVLRRVELELGALLG